MGILGFDYQLSDWVNDINLAKQTGIDAFAREQDKRDIVLQLTAITSEVNIGTDNFTDTQV